MSFFADRAADTDKKLRKLERALKKHLGADSARILREDTCIYVVGSGGRGEMSAHSDVDLFVARVGRSTSAVDAFQVRQAVARAFFELRLPDPSQGGSYLEMHTADSLCDRMGTPADDAANTLTARMLLLLESRPLLGGVAYGTLLERIVESYWKNPEHHGDYQPFTLVNDIVRYWRILLLNYVAKNVEKEGELDEPALEADRRLRSYKLRFSRCMTCFSMLARLLAVTGKGEVTKTDVLAAVREFPVGRLRTIARLIPQVDARVKVLLKLYQAFLTSTSASKGKLQDDFNNKEIRASRSKESREFGDVMFELLQVLGREGRGKELFRHMVV